MDNGQRSVKNHTLFEDSPVYQMACRQLESVAGAIDLDENIVERMFQPKRSLVVSVPIRMENGQTHNFLGFRVLPPEQAAAYLRDTEVDLQKTVKR